MKILKEKLGIKLFVIIGLSLLAIVLCLFTYTARDYGSQAMNAFYLTAEFEGEYKVADGEWHSYVKGRHIPSNKGDVMLKGQFNLVVPTSGEVVGKAFSDGLAIGK